MEHVLARVEHTDLIIWGVGYKANAALCVKSCNLRHSQVSEILPVELVCGYLAIDALESTLTIIAILLSIFLILSYLSHPSNLSD